MGSIAFKVINWKDNFDDFDEKFENTSKAMRKKLVVKFLEKKLVVKFTIGPR